MAIPVQVSILASSISGGLLLATLAKYSIANTTYVPMAIIRTKITTVNQSVPGSHGHGETGLATSTTAGEISVAGTTVIGAAAVTVTGVAEEIMLILH